MARALLSSAVSGMQIVKPQPPDDMWQRLAEAMNDIGTPATPPPNTFQVKDIQEKLKLSYSQARCRVEALVKLGKVEKKCRIGNRIYFSLVNDISHQPGTKPRR